MNRVCWKSTFRKLKDQYPPLISHTSSTVKKYTQINIIILISLSIARSVGNHYLELVLIEKLEALHLHC